MSKTSETKLIQVLLVEDSEMDTELVRHELKKAAFQVNVHRVETAEQFTKTLKDSNWDIVLSDFSMPGFSGIEALNILREHNKDTPFLLLSGTVGEETAVTAMKAGANDYIMKNYLGRLVPAIGRELREAENRKKLRESETQLLHSQRLEAIGRLAGGIAHDYNNILSIIIMHCDALLDRIPKDELNFQEVEQIKKSSERAAGLTRQLLAFSRKHILEPKILNLNFIVKNIEKMLTRLIGEHIALKTITDSTIGTIKIDPGQIEQVILNLAVNARDAMPEGGQLSVTTQRVQLAQQTLDFPNVPIGNYVLLTVSDTGCGMTEEVRDHMFDPFFTTKGPNKGTGLGLSIVHGITRQSSGFISVASSPGSGTQIRILLPELQQKPDWQGDVKEVAVTPTRSAKLLLVEDEPELREILVTSLEQKGYQVLSFSNALDALNFLSNESNGVDLLLTDVVMPKLSGPDLVHQVIQKQPHLKVLYMSGYLDDLGEKLSLRPGQTGLLQKPFTVNLLVTRVEELLSFRSR